MSCISGQTILEEKLKLLRREKADTEYVDAQLLLLNSYVNTKANTSDVTTALALKANTSDVTTSLALKANAADVTTSLALKANTSDVNTSLALKVNTTDYTAALALKVDRTADGKVGIGTTTPTNNLNVVGNSAIIQVEDSTPVATGLTGTGGQISFGGQYRNAGDNVVGAYIKASKTNGVIGDYGHDLVFANNTYPSTLTQKMIIKSNGRVGIGTTTPETRLDVVGNSIQCSNQGRFKGWYSDSQGSGLATEIGISLSEGFLIAYDRTTLTYAPLNLVAGSSANIKLLTNGNVGIGTQTPNYRLHVEGSGTANEIVGWFNNQGAFSSSIAVRQASKTAYLTNHSGSGTPNYDGQLSNAISWGVSSGASPIQFWNGNTGVGSRGTAKMTILENGNVGIGTNAPALTLDVAGGSVGNSTGDLTLNVNSTGVGGALKVAGGSGILSTDSGGFASKHLVITINGTVYKIKLEHA